MHDFTSLYCSNLLKPEAKAPEHPHPLQREIAFSDNVNFEPTGPNEAKQADGEKYSCSEAIQLDLPPSVSGLGNGI